jgi:CobQ-like glutamine amidotransferase family enzyme
VRAESCVRVAVLYPRLLGTYGDAGNAIVLRRRCVDRGIGCDVVSVSPGDAVPTAADVYLLGGAEDANQASAAAMLRADGALARAVDRGAVVLGVCAGYQLLGRTMPGRDGPPLPGLGLLDVTTTWLPRRAVGDVVATPVERDDVPVLLGFENHGGRTTLGPAARPLAHVVTGVGNGDADHSEGAVQGRVVGTYLHGPVLATNPALADCLLRMVVGALPAIDDERVAAVSTAARRRRLAVSGLRARQRRAISSA